MKKILLLIFIVISFRSAQAQYVSIPDNEFRQFLQVRFPSAFDVNELMDTTNPVIVNAASLNIGVSVMDWDGFQYFKNLQSVTFDNLNLTYIPALPNTLQELIIGSSASNLIDNLPALPGGLLRLYCRQNHLTTLPALPSTLVYLDLASSHSLTALPTLPPGLQYLNCVDCNFLTEFPPLPNSIVHLECTNLFLWTSTVLPTLPTSLQFLNASGNFWLTALPALPANIDTLIINENALTSLPVLPAGLKYLSCNNNQLSSLPALPATIEYMDISFNQLTTIPALPAALINLMAKNNSLTSLPAFPSLLTNVNVNHNQITSLPPLNTGLSILNCSYNQVTVLPSIPSTISSLDCSFNLITAIPALPNTLTGLTFYHNQVSNLTVLPDSLRGFECGENLLTSLPAFPSKLESVDCSFNNISELPSLPPTLYKLTCIATHITCIPVLPTGLSDDVTMTLFFDDAVTCIPNFPNVNFNISVYHDDVTPSDNYFNNYPLCSAVNNVHHCAAFPLITGKAYYDNNLNGLYDINEPTRAHVKLQLSDGRCTFTDNNGFYSIATTDTGHYSLAVVNPPVYFTAVPSQADFYFTSFDTLVVKDFGFQQTATVDSLGIAITAINFAARPGFSFPYQVAYQNSGTTSLNAAVVLNYDPSRVTYDSSSNPAVINTGSSLVLSEPVFAPGMQKNFTGYFTVHPSAVIGDSLRAGAHIQSGSIAAKDTSVREISGSFDPNDKSATPKFTTTQVAGGDYIYYTIRFQNTGTDTAFNIVVTDTLSSSLQAATLQMIATSHPCITTVKGNTVSFEFINILLPDSNANELKSHGYISFRIKPVNTLVVNDIVPNKASIYFDYNSPVVTNLATTIIVEPVVVPLKLLSFTVSRGAGATANCYWQTNDEVNVKNYVVEMSTDGRTFIPVASEIAKGFAYNNYSKTISIPQNNILYFRLQMNDVDDRYSYSNVVILKATNDQHSFSLLNNPVKDELSIVITDESLSNSTATIYNAQGLKIKTFVLKNGVTVVNIASLPSGTYYLVTKNGSLKFVKG